MNYPNQQGGSSISLGKVLVFGGLAVGGWWLWKRRNINNQIDVGAPRIKGLRGTNLVLALPVTNISDVDVSFHGFLGYFNARQDTQSSYTRVGTAKSVTATSGVTIKAGVDTEIEVLVSLNLLQAGSIIYKLVTGGDLSKFEAYLEGNYYVTAAKIEVPYNQRLV
jgi:hypothetical protein